LNAHYDGVRVYTSDFNNNRVLIHNAWPTAMNQDANVVIGQDDFVSNSGGTAANKLSRPRGVWSNGTQLAIVDNFNSRVLLFQTIPTANGRSANIVLGQPNFITGTSNTGGLGASSLNRPGFAFLGTNRLYISDTSNNRVLIYQSIPTATQQAADLVLGQPNFTSNTLNNGGLSAQSLRSPGGV
jgi:hypothetical protein